jgi:thioredoxin 2
MAAPAIVVCPRCSTKNRVPPVATGAPKCAKCGAPLPWVTDAGDFDFEEVVASSTVPVLVDLWAPWCGPCRMVSPALERLASDYAGRVKLVKIDVDRAPEIASRFAVQGIPTLLVTKGGHPVARQTGAAGEPQLRAWLEHALGETDAEKKVGA